MLTNVEAIASKLVDRFNVEMDIYQVSENSMEALNLMGMLKLGKKAIGGQVRDQQLRMPVDCYEIEAVYRMPNPRETLTNSVTLTIQEIMFPPQKIFVPVPNSDSEIQTIAFPDQILNYLPHVVGPYIDFTWDPPFIKLNEVEPQIIVFYNRIPIDPDSGLAEIPDQAFDGCVNYCLYTWYQPLFLTGKVPEYVFNKVEKWKNAKINQSKTSLMMSKLSQNEMSKVHNIMSSFDRKRTRLDS